MIEEPMVFQPIGIGMKKEEPALLTKVNETLLDLAGSASIMVARSDSSI
jgi:polar amino acid transport system substrate-binding protein